MEGFLAENSWPESFFQRASRMQNAISDVFLRELQRQEEVAEVVPVAHAPICSPGTLAASTMDRSVLMSPPGGPSQPQQHIHGLQPLTDVVRAGDPPPAPSLSTSDVLSFATHSLRHAMADVSIIVQRFLDSLPSIEESKDLAGQPLASFSKPALKSGEQPQSVEDELRNKNKALQVRVYELKGQYDVLQQKFNGIRGVCKRKNELIDYIKETLWSEVVMLREQLHRQAKNMNNYTAQYFSIFDFVRFSEEEEEEGAFDPSSLKQQIRDAKKNFTTELAKVKNESRALLEAREAEIRTLQTTNGRLLDEAKTLEESLSFGEASMMSLHNVADELKKKNNRLDELETALQLANEKIDMLQDAEDGFKDQMEKTHNHIDKMIESKDVDLVNKAKLVEKLEEQLAEMVVAKEAVQQQADKNEHAAQLLDKCRVELVDRERDLELEKDLTAELRKQITELEARKKKLETENERLNRNARDATNILTHAEERQKEMEQLKKRNNELQYRLHEAEGEMHSLEQQQTMTLERLHKTEAELEETLGGAEAAELMENKTMTINDLKADMSKSAMTIEGLQSQAADERTKREKIQGEFDALRKRMDATTLGANNARDAAAQKEAEAARLQTRVAELEEEVKKAKASQGSRKGGKSDGSTSRANFEPPRLSESAVEEASRPSSSGPSSAGVSPNADPPPPRRFSPSSTAKHSTKAVAKQPSDPRLTTAESPPASVPSPSGSPSAQAKSNEIRNLTKELKSLQNAVADREKQLLRMETELVDAREAVQLHVATVGELRMEIDGRDAEIARLKHACRDADQRAKEARVVVATTAAEAQPTPSSTTAPPITIPTAPSLGQSKPRSPDDPALESRRTGSAGGPRRTPVDGTAGAPRPTSAGSLPSVSSVVLPATKQLEAEMAEMKKTVAAKDEQCNDLLSRLMDLEKDKRSMEQCISLLRKNQRSGSFTRNQLRRASDTQSESQVSLSSHPEYDYEDQVRELRVALLPVSEDIQHARVRHPSLASSVKSGSNASGSHEADSYIAERCILVASLVANKVLGASDRLQQLQVAKDVIKRSLAPFGGREVGNPASPDEAAFFMFTVPMHAAQFCIFVLREWEKQKKSSGMALLDMRLSAHIGQVVVENGEVFGPVPARALTLNGLARPSTTVYSAEVFDSAGLDMATTMSVLDNPIHRSIEVSFGIDGGEKSYVHEVAPKELGSRVVGEARNIPSVVWDPSPTMSSSARLQHDFAARLAQVRRGVMGSAGDGIGAAGNMMQLALDGTTVDAPRTPSTLQHDHIGHKQLPGTQPNQMLDVGGQRTTHGRSTGTVESGHVSWERGEAASLHSDLKATTTMEGVESMPMDSVPSSYGSSPSAAGPIGQGSTPVDYSPRNNVDAADTTTAAGSAASSLERRASTMIRRRVVRQVARREQGTMTLVFPIHRKNEFVQASAGTHDVEVEAVSMQTSTEVQTDEKDLFTCPRCHWSSSTDADVETQWAPPIQPLADGSSAFACTQTEGAVLQLVSGNWDVGDGSALMQALGANGAHQGRRAQSAGGSRGGSNVPNAATPLMMYANALDFHESTAPAHIPRRSFSAMRRTRPVHKLEHAHEQEGLFVGTKDMPTAERPLSGMSNSFGKPRSAYPQTNVSRGVTGPSGVPLRPSSGNSRQKFNQAMCDNVAKQVSAKHRPQVVAGLSDRSKSRMAAGAVALTPQRFMTEPLQGSISRLDNSTSLSLQELEGSGHSNAPTLLPPSTSAICDSFGMDRSVVRPLETNGDLDPTDIDIGPEDPLADSVDPRFSEEALLVTQGEPNCVKVEGGHVVVVAGSRAIRGVKERIRRNVDVGKFLETYGDELLLRGPTKSGSANSAPYLAKGSKRKAGSPQN